MKNLNIINSKVLNALAFIESDKKKLFYLLRQTADIPSPTFSERKKTLFLQNQLSQVDYKTIIDSHGNLCGHIGNLSKDVKKILIVAHIDTVLKPVTKTKETDKYLFGHGVCDNSTGVLALLTILRIIKALKLTFPSQLYYAFTVQEEGLGGKKGMKFVTDKIKDIDAVVNLESHNVGRIVNQSPGQYRLEFSIEVKKAGHSFRDFGNPNAIIAISKFITEFSKLPGFKRGDTTYNIGKIEGGEGINAIAKKGRFLLEIRSLKQDKLIYLKEQLKKLSLAFFDPKKGIQLTPKVFVDTEAASFPKTHKIYRLTHEVHTYLGIRSFFEMGNNDGEISLSKGIPTVTIGSSIGYKTHSFDEYVDKKSFILGLKQDLLVVLNVLHNF